MRRNGLIRVTLYSRAGVSCTKNSWPAGAEMQPMQRFVNACMLQGLC